MNNTSNKDKGFSTDSTSGENDTSYEKGLLMLDHVEGLDKEKITTHFAANKHTRCLEIMLNHIYANKKIITRIYADWTKTLEFFTRRARDKGVSQEHIMMLTETLDNNYQKVLDYVFEKDEMKEQISALELVNERVVDSFLDETKAPYVAIRQGGRIETIPIESKRFEDWVGSMYYHQQKDYNTAPSILSKEEITKIESILRYEAASAVRKLYLRIAAFVDSESADLDENVIYYDLCNSNWEIVKITRHGWSIIKHDENHILFKRFTIMNPQVYPRKDYPPDILQEFVKLINIEDDEDNKLLATVYIISLFLLADLPKPMLNPNGPHGSGKSTYQEDVKLIVDPAAALTTAFPSSLPELVQALSHSYVTFFDNVSGISEVTSDQLCRAVTGSGFVKRSLYTNDEDVIYNMKRAVGYNGINVSAHKADLLDRLLNLKLKHIDKRKRKKIKQLQKEFERILPYLLGYIFDLLVKILGRLGEVKLEELPRMADFAEMGELISRCLGNPDGLFTDAYNRNIGQTNDEVINSNLVATAINLLMNKQKILAGKAGELLANFNELASKDREIQNLVNNRWWPKTPRAFSNRLTEIEPNLKEVGIIIEGVEDKHSKSTEYIITNTNYSSDQSPENELEV
jgi:hypothetical protein